ncbi:hypothetical protein CcaverHIS002_0202960 [Cutaneotrichosporon cavernicola]|nr:hypothetical protein CcaverHIS002_0202960 [Cutaneotrichosporon cavernicola]
MGAAMGEYDEYGVARPISPTARRRMIIMREMSESLRRSECFRVSSADQKTSSSSARSQQDHLDLPATVVPPPSVHTHMSRGSAQNLAQLREHARETGFDTSGFQRHSATFQDMRPDKALERHNSQPNLMAYAEKRSPLAGQDQVPPRQASLSPTEQKRRQNLLGHGFLRPLTRADEGGINRTQSAAALNLGVTSPTSERTVSPTASSGAHRSSSGGYHSSSGFHHPHAHLHATAMVRSSTEGDHVARERSNKREAQRRQERTDTGYRFHGW